MPDLVIRDFEQEELDALKQLAAPQSVQQWSKAYIKAALKAPRVSTRYIIRAFGPGPRMAFIRRADDTMNDPREGQMNLSPEQEIAYQQALEFVKRNGPSDREAALKALASQFETVFETLM